MLQNDAISVFFVRKLEFFSEKDDIYCDVQRGAVVMHEGIGV